MPCITRALAGAALAVGAAHGYDGPVEKRTFTLPSYTTLGGRTSANVRLGHET